MRRSIFLDAGEMIALNIHKYTCNAISEANGDLMSRPRERAYYEQLFGCKFEPFGSKVYTLDKQFPFPEEIKEIRLMALAMAWAVVSYRPSRVKNS